MKNEEKIQGNQQQLSLSDWFLFLESRANANTNIILVRISILISIIIMLWIIYDSYKSDVYAGIAMGVITGSMMIVAYYFVNELIKDEKGEALVARKLINEITLGNLRDPKEIKEKWKEKPKKNKLFKNRG